ncbi:MAG: 3-oxoacyl-[acyl-carrier-protein] reductase [Acidobacteria bacterium]|nr:3-oxoacyl-[acyl-carrier-protein] reductase [Acidobacteriota bacterium]MBI3657406.1 3-oxoacyl-[acyl-carrier-protein] reductase [Acidobacteriota bacterium]
MFNDKVAWVTGSSRGIGLACARLLAEAGATVVLCSRHLEATRAIAAQWVSEGLKAVPKQLDVADYDNAQSVAAEILAEFSKIDILVNNAAITRDTLLLRMKKEDWDAVLDANLSGVFHCSKPALNSMVRKRYGRIVSLTSVVAQTGNPGQANYIAAKAGIIGFTKAIAREVASRNITVNAVAPGFIDTEMTRNLPESTRSKLVEIIPLGRIGSDVDVAQGVKFLASDEAAYITGQVLNINGGMYM